MERKNVPEIRFEGFDDDWEQCKIEDIAEIVSGGTPDTNNPSYWDGDINWYAPAEIVDQIYVSKSERKITELGLQKSSAKMLPANRTILFTSRAGIGKVAILQNSACTNQGFQSLVLKNEIDPYFVYSMGNQLKEKAEAVASGSTFLEISGKMLANLDIMMPNKDEQEKIATHFKSIDKLIIFHQRKYENLKLFKEAMLDKMFPKNGEKVPEIRFKGFTSDWEEHKVGDCYDFKNGLNKGKEYFGEGTPIVNFMDVFHNRGIYLQNLKGRVTLENSEIKNYEVKKGDLFFTRTSETIDEIGYPSVMLEDAQNIVFSGFVLRGRTILNEDPLDNEFKKYAFFTNTFRKEMIKKSSMTTRALTSGTAIKNMKFKYPAIKEEQQKIGKYFTNLDNLIIFHQRKYEKLKFFKEAMLNKMLI